MNIFSSTDKGKVRSSNQDAVATGLFSDGTVWAIVCDGMGGASGGNIASRLAVEYLSASLKSGYRANMGESSIKNLLETAIYAANIRVFDKSRENSELNGMGTTVVIAIATEKEAYFSHVGDSRAYLIDENNITQITRDHSIVQSMIEEGKISAEEAKHHPRKNVITRALGVDESVVPEFTVCDFKENEKILLCTDGLSNFVDANDIKGILIKDGSDDYSKQLVDLANDNGGGDNITAVVIQNK